VLAGEQKLVGVQKGGSSIHWAAIETVVAALDSTPCQRVGGRCVTWPFHVCHMTLYFFMCVA